MALIDDKTLTEVGTDWKLLLDGQGIITNMSGPNENLLYRFDSDVPDGTVSPDAVRVIYGRSDYNNKDSFINESSDSKIYGKTESGLVKVLVTKEV